MQAQSWRILHIEDDEDDQFLVRSMLKEAKGQTVTLDFAATFEEGRQKLNEQYYDAVLVDYDLGARTGIELIREFVQKNYAAPFILLTGRGSYDVDVEAMRAGATLYLTKNEVNALLLERSVRYAIERKQVESALRERDRKLSIALEAAQLGAWTYYFDDHMLEMDARAQEIYHANQPREDHDRIVQNLLHPDDVPLMWETLNRAADPAGDGRYHIEYRVLNADGSICWLSAWGLTEFEGQGTDRQAVRLAGATREITWEKQAGLALEESNRALRASEERFQIASRAVSGVLYDVYLNREEIYQSEGLERVVGFRPGDEPGGSKDWWPRNIHPEDYPRVQSSLRAAIESRTDSFAYDYRIRHKDGHWVYIWDQGYIVRDENGRAQRLVGICTDISERVRNEQALRESEREHQDQDASNRFRDLANNIPQLAWMAVSSGHVFWYNQRWLEYTGTTREEMEREGWQKLLHPEHIEQVARKINQHFVSGERWEETFQLRGQDGQYRWFLCQANPIADEHGQVVRWFGTNTDITEQLLLQEENRKQKEMLEQLVNATEAQTVRLEAVLQSLPVGVWISDRDGRLIGKNKQADRIWAGSAPLVEGVEQYAQYTAWYADDGKVLTPEEYPLTRALRTQQPVEPVELQIRRFDGSEGTVLVSAAPIKDKDGRLVEAVAINVDITERKQAEEALRKNNESIFLSEGQHRELAQALEIERAKLSAAIDQLPLGVGIADAEGNTLSLNSAGLKLHGFASEADMFSRLEKYIEEFELCYLDGKLMPVEEWPASKALRGEFVKDYELRLHNLLHDTEKIVSYSAAPVYNSAGEMMMIVYVIQDLTDRKRSEEALRESEARYRLASRATNDVIWDWDLGTNTIQWNEALTVLLGYSAAEQFSSSSDWWKDRVHPEDRAAVVKHIHEVIAGDGEVWTAAYRFMRADGSYAEIYDRGWVVRGANGRPVRMVGAMRDITSRNAVENAIRESEARFRQLADAMPQLVWTANPDGSVDYYNQRYQKYGGIAPTVGGNWNWGPVVHVDDLQPTIDAWAEAVRTTNTYQIEHRVRMADGSYRWHLSRGIPAFDERGNVIKWYGTATDIHDFKEAQEMLRHREKRLRSLFESNLIGIVTRDQAGHILEANDAYLQMIGYTHEDVEAGRCNAREITPPEYHYLEQAWTEEVQANGYCRPFEKEYIRKDGTRIPVLVGYSLFETDQTEYIGFVLDLSELKRAQAELAAYAEKLKRSNEELESFAFVASHDLQEPLRKINLFGSSLRRQLDGQLPEKAEEYLDRMQNATERMQAMINGLLELSRVNTRGSSFESVDLNALAEEVVSDLEARIHSTGGQVIIEPLPTVEGDALQLRLLLQNLVGNGLKFHKDGVAPVVRVSGEALKKEKPPRVRIVVEDNGIGFDQESADQIFQPFVRLNGRSQYEGSGMGLAICRKIVERHDGSITAISQPDEGSKFVITLPVTAGQVGK